MMAKVRRRCVSTRSRCSGSTAGSLAGRGITERFAPFPAGGSRGALAGSGAGAGARARQRAGLGVPGCGTAGAAARRRVGVQGETRVAPWCDRRAVAGAERDGTLQATLAELHHPRGRGWWTCPGSNRRPLECDSSALPAELQAHVVPGKTSSVGGDPPARDGACTVAPRGCQGRSRGFPGDGRRPKAVASHREEPGVPRRRAEAEGRSIPWRSRGFPGDGRRPKAVASQGGAGGSPATGGGRRP